jgi:CheY-like chemotaxis protein
MARVLLVEDEFLVRQLAADELADAGHVVTEAENGDSAYQILLGQEPFDLVMTDIRMPGALDGWALGAEALRLRPSLKVVYSSGFSTETRPLTERERMLPKPYRMNQLVDLVDALLGGSAVQQT